MTTSKHTPGWYAEQSLGYMTTGDFKGFAVYAENGDIIGKSVLGLDGTNVAHQRAVLFAAAPDLLAALEESYDILMSAGGHGGPTVAKIRAAIAKARGQS